MFDERRAAKIDKRFDISRRFQARAFSGRYDQTIFNDLQGASPLACRKLFPAPASKRAQENVVGWRHGEKSRQREKYRDRAGDRQSHDAY